MCRNFINMVSFFIVIFKIKKIMLVLSLNDTSKSK